MSVFRSVSFGLYAGHDEIPTKVLGLFNELVEHSDKRIEFASEIIESGLRGRIDLDRPFSIDGFEAAIRKNNNLCKDSRRKKFSSIDFTDNRDDETSRSGEIAESSLNNLAVDKMKDAFEEFIDDDELRYAVETIMTVNEHLIVSDDVDLICALRQAKRGIPTATDIVKQVCKKYKLVSELVYTVLNSGRDLEELFAY